MHTLDADTFVVGEEFDTGEILLLLAGGFGDGPVEVGFGDEVG